MYIYIYIELTPWEANTAEGTLQDQSKGSALEHRKGPVVPTPVLDANSVGRPDIVFLERRDRRCCVWQHGCGSVYLQSLW